MDSSITKNKPHYGHIKETLKNSNAICADESSLWNIGLKRSGEISDHIVKHDQWGNISILNITINKHTYTHIPGTNSY